jgi:glucosamine-6-phosphate deaminase
MRSVTRRLPRAAEESPLTSGAAPARQFHVDKIKVEIYPDKPSAGAAAARAAAAAIRGLAADREAIAVLFATGASQFEILNSLTQMRDLPWRKLTGFHLDEYVNLSPDHPASFRRYLRERLTQKAPLGAFFEIDGSAPDPYETARAYADRLRAANPQLCLLGIGENGHLAFNEPSVADFSDPLDVKVVRLDAMCREQQAAEGWFASAADVPGEAITVTIPALLRVPKLIASVPGIRKAAIVRRTLEDPISTACPATILRTHPDVTLYLDAESASELGTILPS